jgi:hypothetical protein
MFRNLWGKEISLLYRHQAPITRAGDGCFRLYCMRSSREGMSALGGACHGGIRRSCRLLKCRVSETRKKWCEKPFLARQLPSCLALIPPLCDVIRTPAQTKQHKPNNSFPACSHQEIFINASNALISLPDKVPVRQHRSEDRRRRKKLTLIRGIQSKHKL